MSEECIALQLKNVQLINIALILQSSKFIRHNLSKHSALLAVNMTIIILVSLKIDNALRSLDVYYDKTRILASPSLDKFRQQLLLLHTIYVAITLLTMTSSRYNIRMPMESLGRLANVNAARWMKTCVTLVQRLRSQNYPKCSIIEVFPRCSVHA